MFAWIDYTDTVVDAPSFVLWKYREGVAARYGQYDMTFAPNLFINSRYYPADDRMELVGSEGIIWINRFHGNMLQEPSLVLYREGETRSFEALRDDWGNSFIDSGRDFFRCIKEEREPTLSGEVGLKVLQFSLAPEISSREKREVEPSTIDL